MASGATARTKLSPGSGLGQEGVSLNHHFVMSVHKSSYNFGAGEYLVQLFARQAGHPAPALLSEIRINITDVHVGILGNQGSVLFEPEPETQTCKGHASERAERPEGAEHG